MVHKNWQPFYATWHILYMATHRGGYFILRGSIQVSSLFAVNDDFRFSTFSRTTTTRCYHGRGDRMANWWYVCKFVARWDILYPPWFVVGRFLVPSLWVFPYRPYGHAVCSQLDFENSVILRVLSISLRRNKKYNNLLFKYIL